MFVCVADVLINEIFNKARFFCCAIKAITTLILSAKPIATHDVEASVEQSL